MSKLVSNVSTNGYQETWVMSELDSNHPRIRSNSTPSTLCVHHKKRPHMYCLYPTPFKYGTGKGSNWRTTSCVTWGSICIGINSERHICLSQYTTSGQTKGEKDSIFVGLLSGFKDKSDSLGQPNQNQAHQSNILNSLPAEVGGGRRGWFYPLGNIWQCL